MRNLTEGPTHRTRFFLALGRKDAHLLNPEDVGADHKCKETENAIQKPCGSCERRCRTLRARWTGNETRPQSRVFSFCLGSVTGDSTYLAATGCRPYMWKEMRQVGKSR